MGKRKNRIVRFAVGDPTRVLSSVWTMSASSSAVRSDVYLSADHFRSHIHVSLHEGRNRGANQHVRYQPVYLDTRQRTRGIRPRPDLLAWTPTYIRPGLERALNIYFLMAESEAVVHALPSGLDPADVCWIQPPPLDACVLVSVHIVDVGCPWAPMIANPVGDYAASLARHTLPNGRVVRVVAVHVQPPPWLTSIVSSSRDVADPDRRAEAERVGAQGFWMGRASEGYGCLAEVPPTGPLVQPGPLTAQRLGGILMTTLPDAFTRGHHPSGEMLQLLLDLASFAQPIEIHAPTVEQSGTDAERERYYRRTVDALRSAQVHGFAILDLEGSAEWDGLPALVRTEITPRGRRFLDMNRRGLSRDVPPLPPGDGDERQLVRVRPEYRDRYPQLDPAGLESVDGWSQAVPDSEDPEVPYGGAFGPYPRLLVQSPTGAIRVEAIDVNSRRAHAVPVLSVHLAHDSFKLAVDGRLYE